MMVIHRSGKRLLVAIMVVLLTGCGPAGAADSAVGGDLHDFVADFTRHVLAALVL